MKLIYKYKYLFFCLLLFQCNVLSVAQFDNQLLQQFNNPVEQQQKIGNDITQYQQLQQQLPQNIQQKFFQIQQQPIQALNNNNQPNLSTEQQQQLIQLTLKLLQQQKEQQELYQKLILQQQQQQQKAQNNFRFQQKQKWRKDKANINTNLVEPEQVQQLNQQPQIMGLIPNSRLNRNDNFDHGFSNVNYPNLHKPTDQAYMSIPKQGVLSSYPVTARPNIVGVNNHGNGLQSTEHILGIKGNMLAQNANNNYDFPLRIPTIGQCPCAGKDQCRCGDAGPNDSDCSCAPKPSCPPCVVAKTMRQMHQLASEFATQDIETQENLNKQSLLEKKLFEQAQKYAQDAEHEEEEARKSALDLQQHSSKAQTDRNKMMRAEQQAKQIALDSIRTMTIHPPHEITGFPGMSIEKTGVKTNVITEKTPYYNINIGRTDGSGFNDITQQVIQQDIAESYMNAPDHNPLSNHLETTIPNINQQPDGNVRGGEFTNHDEEELPLLQ